PDVADMEVPRLGRYGRYPARADEQRLLLGVVADLCGAGGDRRPHVGPASARPAEIGYDPEEEALLVGEGRISPVPPEAWDFHVGDIRMLELWFHRRTTAPDLPAWTQEWTSELLELITVLTLLTGLRASRPELSGPYLTRSELRAAGVLPVPPASRRPASVLDHHEEGPEGQFALL
ncbi:type ISP restriction/modification enzyme, partial [Streptomyces beijiangensis]